VRPQNGDTEKEAQQIQMAIGDLCLDTGGK
jgi:hypothetical protein